MPTRVDVTLSGAQNARPIPASVGARATVLSPTVSTPSSSRTMSFGMQNDMPGGVVGTYGNDYGAFNTTAPAMGGRTYINCARIFSGSIPTVTWNNVDVGGAGGFGGLRKYTDAGVITMFSMVNNDYAGMLAGSYNTRLDNFVASMPNNQILILNHEPENPSKPWAADPLNRYVATQIWFYDRVKAVNPTIKVIQSHMTYQWGSSGSTTGTPANWIVPANKTDGYGADTYHFSFMNGEAVLPSNIGDISTDPQGGFPRWYSFFRNLGKPLGFCEFAIQSHPSNFPADPDIADDARAVWIADSLDYLKSLGNIDFVMYWNSDNNPDGDDAITPVSTWPLSNAAWTNFVTANGKANYTVDQFLGITP